jgi:periplasmic divalent cation tolerance protein
MRTGFVLAFVTAPDIRTARKLASGALKNRLAACANIVPGVESHYWWQSKLDSSRELLVIFKTTAPKVKLLENHILAHHPYDTPEFVVTEISQGSKKYLRWISDSVKAPEKTHLRP